MVAFIFTSGCKESSKITDHPVTESIADPIIDPDLESILIAYPHIPETSAIITAGSIGTTVYALCRQRYKEQLAALKKEANSLGAKLILAVLTPEIGEAVTVSTQKGVPFIMLAAASIGIKAYDISAQLAKYTSLQITQMPADGHWSAAGAKIVADLFIPIIANNNGYKSSVTFPDSIRPAAFGDLEPGLNTALDGGKNIPYQLITNSQGLRMGYDLHFPKIKQRILLLGDSQIYSPFLDNSRIASELLQQRFPDKEIINAGMLGYTIEDYLSLLTQKTKYAEPDIIILVTNPNDIGDMYFTQRNHMSRFKKAYKPTEAEKTLYHALFH